MLLTALIIVVCEDTVVVFIVRVNQNNKFRRFNFDLIVFISKKFSLKNIFSTIFCPRTVPPRSDRCELGISGWSFLSEVSVSIAKWTLGERFVVPTWLKHTKNSVCRFVVYTYTHTLYSYPHPTALRLSFLIFWLFLWEKRISLRKHCMFFVKNRYRQWELEIAQRCYKRLKTVWSYTVIQLFE